MESLKTKIWGSNKYIFAKYFDLLSIKEIAEVIREKNAFQKLINEMSIKEVAKSVMQNNNFINDLQDQIHSLKLQAIEWDIPPVDCKALAYTESGEELTLKD